MKPCFGFVFESNFEKIGLLYVDSSSNCLPYAKRAALTMNTDISVGQR